MTIYLYRTKMINHEVLKLFLTSTTAKENERCKRRSVRSGERKINLVSNQTQLQRW